MFHPALPLLIPRCIYTHPFHPLLSFRASVTTLLVCFTSCAGFDGLVDCVRSMAKGMHQYGRDVTSAQKSCICGTTFVCNKDGVISHEVQRYQPVKLQSQCISPPGQVKACSLWNATQGAHFDLRGLPLQCFFSPAGPVTLKQHKEAKKARVQPKNMGVKHGVFYPSSFFNLWKHG